MKRLQGCSLLGLLAVLTWTLSAAPVIRMGTLAPQGTAWHKILSQMGAEWRQATSGSVQLRIYPGGTVGDEAEMIRKMRIGQLQAAAISNAGLAEIEPSAYALMLPLLFESYEEWDWVRQQVNPQLEERLQQKGFVLLAWSDVGWVYFFSKEPLQHPEQLKNMKLAASATETAAVEIIKWAGFNPVPITTVDTLTGLQTGLIDAVYMPLLLAEGSQIYRHTGHMLDLKWAPLQGAVILHENAWRRLKEEQRQQILEIARRHGAELRQSTRQHEQASLQAMQERGLKVWPVEEETRREWLETVSRAYTQIRENLVPPEMFDQVVRLRDEYRSQKNRAGSGF